jgi:DNA-binding LacI/PurR family transcriptional regulator
MGAAAAENVLRRISLSAKAADSLQQEVFFEPQLIVRETTTTARKRPAMLKKHAGSRR